MIPLYKNKNKLKILNHKKMEIYNINHIMTKINAYKKREINYKNKK